MRCLIVHDRDEVGKALERITFQTIGPSAIVDHALDVFSARDLLSENYYDLLVVDLTLPIRFGKSDASLANAQLLLGEIFEGGVTRAPGDVLGISLDVEVLELVRTDIGEHLMGCIHEDAEGAWQNSFEHKLKYLMKARRARQFVTNSSYDLDLVIVTALDKEAGPYSDLFGLTESDQFSRAKQFTFDDRSGTMRRGVLYAIGSSGQPPCAAATQALLTQFRPKLILMTGFCGGVKHRVRIGDIVAFRHSAPWDYGKWEEREIDGEKHSTFRARATALSGSEGQARGIVRDIINDGKWPDADTLSAASVISRRSTPQLRLQGAGSGSAVVTSTFTLDQITALDDNIWAIDMESYAFYYACRNTPVLAPDFICIKGVADHCNGAKSSKHHAACSALSARLAHHIVRRRYDF